MEMKWLRMFAGVLFMTVALGFAQETKEQEMPEIAVPRKPEPEEQTGVLRGNKPFSLTTDPDGEFVYKFNEDNELESLEAKKGVVFTSEDMTLNADRLDYKAIKGELTATGKRVVVRQGDLIITCKLFKYYPERQHSEFIGNAVVYNKTRDGKVQTTAADKIVVDIVDGKAQMKVQGGGRVRPKMSQAAAAPNIVATPGSGGARAMVTDQSPSAPARSLGEDVGVSQPVPPQETDSTSAQTVKVAPVAGLEAVVERSSAASEPADQKPRRIDPSNRNQMEALSRGAERK